MVPIFNPKAQNTMIAQSPEKNEAVVKQTDPSSSKPTSSQLTHTVSPGETVFGISKKYGVTMDQLKNWNKIGSQNIISVGQKLVIFRP
jgi:membrane-bound lytic murein transglycosylase D